jgi:hypothetical protein
MATITGSGGQSPTARGWWSSSTTPTCRQGRGERFAYDPSFQWDWTDYFGASLRALKELGERKGYVLVYYESRGVNAFFVEASAVPSGFAPLPLEAVYRPPN